MANTRKCTSCGFERKLEPKYFNFAPSGEEIFSDVCRLCEAETGQEKTGIRQSWEQGEKVSEGTGVALGVVAAVAVIAIGVLAVIYAPRGVVLFYRNVISPYFDWIVH